MRRRIKIYKSKNEIIAILVKKNYKTDGMEFVTPDNFPQQLACISHKKNKIIQAHIHNHIKRTIYSTQEVDILLKGKIKVDLYNTKKKYLESFIMTGGDIVLFADGGHGYKVLRDMEMILVKQGPYMGEKDKTRFIREKK